MLLILPFRLGSISLSLLQLLCPGLLAIFFGRAPFLNYFSFFFPSLLQAITFSTPPQRYVVSRTTSTLSIWFVLEVTQEFPSRDTCSSSPIAITSPYLHNSLVTCRQFTQRYFLLLKLSQTSEEGMRMLLNRAGMEMDSPYCFVAIKFQSTTLPQQCEIQSQSCLLCIAKDLWLTLI